MVVSNVSDSFRQFSSNSDFVRDFWVWFYDPPYATIDLDRLGVVIDRQFLLFVGFPDDQSEIGSFFDEEDNESMNPQTKPPLF